MADDDAPGDLRIIRHERTHAACTRLATDRQSTRRNFLDWSNSTLSWWLRWRQRDICNRQTGAAAVRVGLHAYGKLDPTTRFLALVAAQRIRRRASAQDPAGRTPLSSSCEASWLGSPQRAVRFSKRPHRVRAGERRDCPCSRGNRSCAIGLAPLRDHAGREGEADDPSYR
jgi:hypothetical protein